MNTGIIVKECTKSLEWINIEKEKHLYISVDYDHRIASGYIQVEGLTIITFKKGF